MLRSVNIIRRGLACSSTPWNKNTPPCFGPVSMFTMGMDTVLSVRAFPCMVPFHGIELARVLSMVPPYGIEPVSGANCAGPRFPNLVSSAYKYVGPVIGPPRV